MTDRYIVRESAGVPAISQAFGSGMRRITEIMVMDSWYGYAVVWKSPGNAIMHRSWARKKAARLCAEWNAEHDAALAGEAAQAREGTAS